jgi:hypothetical protein
VPELPLNRFRAAAHLRGAHDGLFVSMSFNETSDAEVAQINKYFPNRTPDEVKRAIEIAKASFHGSRGGNRADILSQLLNQAAPC